MNTKDLDQSKMGMYPFLFIVWKASMFEGLPTYVVAIASTIDYTYANTAWMDNPDLPAGKTVAISIDTTKEIHEFTTQKEAMLFIKDWWAQKEIDLGGRIV